MRRRQQEIWGMKVVGYLFFAGLGSGSFASAAALDLRTNGQSQLITHTGAWTALLCVGLGTLLLLWDLGVPWRMFRLVGNRSSLISVGTIVLSVLLLLATFDIALSIFDLRISAAGRATLMAVTEIFALGTSIYVGFLLAIVKCRPFWNTPMLPLLFVVSSLSTGTSSLVLAQLVAGSTNPVATEFLGLTETTLLCLEFVMVAFYVFAMENSLPEARLGVRRLVVGDLAGIFWGGVVLAGLLLPLVLNSLEITPASLLAAILVLVGGFSLRYTMLLAGARAVLPGELPKAAYVR